MANEKISKISIFYYCELCDYICSKYSIHDKHKTNDKCKRLTNTNEKSPKIAKNRQVNFSYYKC